MQEWLRKEIEQRKKNNTCKKCGGTELEMRNFSDVLREGDLHCANCGAYVRMWDPN